MKKSHLLVLLFLSFVMLHAPSASASATVIADVPAYNWYHGCGPTAAASVLGYWDLHGYGNMFTASGAAVFLTSNVQEQISSSAHNAKYDPNPDNASLSTPPKTSIADWFETSVNQGYGWSYLSRADDAFTGYADYRGYNFNSYYETFAAATNANGFTWSDFVAEINAGRPMMFLVDSNGDGDTDHFVPAFGYENRGSDGLWYGFYDTWSEAETIRWQKFLGMSSGRDWGVGYGVYCLPVSAPVPVPPAVWLLGSGLLGLCGVRRKLIK